MKKAWIALFSLVALVAAATWIPVTASSHREAPLISQDPLADNTDLYAFVSPTTPDKVTIIANFIPLEAPYGGPNFYKFDDNVALRDQDRQQRRRARGRDVPVPVQDDRSQPEHVPLQHRPHHLARFAELERAPVLHGDARRRQRQGRSRSSVLGQRTCRRRR